MPSPFPFARDEARPAEIASDYPLAESVERLHAVVVPAGFDADSSESVMGSVSEQHVRLERNIPWPGGIERPYFVGSFQQGGQGVVLSGHFLMGHQSDFSDGVRFLPALFVLMIFAMLRDLRAWPAPLIVLALYGLCRARTNLKERHFQQGIDWLSSFVRDALTTRSNHALQRTEAGGTPVSRP